MVEARESGEYLWLKKIQWTGVHYVHTYVSRFWAVGTIANNCVGIDEEVESRRTFRIGQIKTYAVRHNGQSANPRGNLMQLMEILWEIVIYHL